MARRAEKLLSGLEDVRSSDRVSEGAVPDPGPPAARRRSRRAGCRSRTGRLEIFTDVDVAVDRGSRVAILGLNGAGKTTCCGFSAACWRPTPASAAGARPAAGLLRPGARDARRRPDDPRAHAQRRARPDRHRTCARSSAPSSSPATTSKAGRGALRRREDPAGAGTLVLLGANVLLLDEPTNNLDPVSREQVLDAIANLPGAIVLVTHDAGAVQALKPDRADPAAGRRRGRVERRPSGVGRARLSGHCPRGDRQSWGSSVVNWCPHRQCDVRASAVRPGAARSRPIGRQRTVCAASTVSHVPGWCALDRVFSQVIDGLWGRGTASARRAG